MIKKFYLKISIIFTLIFCLTSCSEIEALLGLVPKFSGDIPNVISGCYAYYSSDENQEDKNALYHYDFNSKNNTFTLYTEDEDLAGTYSVEYKTFAITECNGMLNLVFEDGEKISYGFYYFATALDGPEYIILNNKDKLYYEGAL